MKSMLLSRIYPWILVPAVLFLFIPKAVQATSQNWQLTVGAESKDGAKQAMAFLPNEIWINPGDSITWTTGSHEGHTVTFLKPGQNRPSNAQGCATIPALIYEDVGADEAAEAPDAATATGEAAITPDLPVPSYDGIVTSPNVACAHSGTLSLPTPTLPVAPKTFTVTFPVAGNFKFVCLIHHDMTGVVHVVSGALPTNDPQVYVDEAGNQAQEILSDADQAKDGEGDDQGGWSSKSDGSHRVITRGEVVATGGGGRQYLTIMRFLPSTIYVHVGDTVTWTNEDATEPHTVTSDPYGAYPNPGADPPPGIGSTKAADGTVLGTLPNAFSCASAGNPAPPEPSSNCFDSNIIGAANQDITGLPQPAASNTHVQVTFTAPGTYNYYCRLHDELGMQGTVIVLP